MIIIKEKGLSFNDITLVPRYSDVKSRKEPSTSFKFGVHELEIPIISSPMNTVSEYEMLWAMMNLGGTGVVHRYMPIDDQMQQLWNIWDIQCSAEELPFFAIGATGDFKDRISKLYEVGVRKFCIDVANGDSEVSIQACKWIRQQLNESILMAGNVCTSDGYKRLIDAGANLVRVGIGPGSACSTRLVTGHGVPQVTALMAARYAKESLGLKDEQGTIIADGGLKNSGDIAKAIAVGADCVMLGSLLAATNEAPGEVHKDILGNKFKVYAGMASKEGRKFNGWFSEEDASYIPEGESTRLPLKGPVKKIVEGLVGGLRVAMSYTGARTLKEFRDNAEVMEITNSSYEEGKPHILNK
jgi:IMP dehydrogenase